MKDRRSAIAVAGALLALAAVGCFVLLDGMGLIGRRGQIHEWEAAKAIVESGKTDSLTFYPGEQRELWISCPGVELTGPIFGQTPDELTRDGWRYVEDKFNPTAGGFELNRAFIAVAEGKIQHVQVSPGATMAVGIRKDALQPYPATTRELITLLGEPKSSRSVRLPRGP